MAKIELRGGPELNRALEELGNTIARRLGKNAVRAGARVIANGAKARAPVGKTGKLKKSIRVFDGPDRGTERSAYAGSRLFYAYWVEHGTAHSPARSFLRASADEGAQDAVDRMTENLAYGIERETQKYRGK
jgi:HK97 gp10 family phage protein